MAWRLQKMLLQLSHLHGYGVLPADTTGHPLRLKEMSCPTCNRQGVSLNFRATMSVRESIYFLTCTACQKTFPERSSLESFE